MKKKLKDSCVNGERHANKELEEKTAKGEKSEYAAAVIRELEDIIKSKKKYRLVSIPTR